MAEFLFFIFFYFFYILAHCYGEIDVCGVVLCFVILELRGVLGVLWSFCILGDIIYRFDKQSV